jgi:acetyl esterase/lipase
VDAQYLRRAGVDPASIAGFVALSGPHDLHPDTAELNAIFAAPFTPQDWQVTARVHGPAPPALLLHGATDRRVWPGASELLAARLHAAGDDVALKIYPHCDHTCTLAALSVPARAKAPALRDIADFLDGLSARLHDVGPQGTARRQQ